jgi:hypothetical protein
LKTILIHHGMFNDEQKNIVVFVQDLLARYVMK